MTGSTSIISVIVATRGDKLTSLERCLESLQKQTFKRFEVIVVYPRNRSEIRDLCRVFDFTPIEQSPKKLSCARQRNKGVRYASCSLISFIDDDCEVPKTWLETIYTTFQQYPSLSCLGGPCRPPPDEQNYFRLTLGMFEKSRRNKVVLDKYAVNKIRGGNVTYKKDVFEKVGCLCPKLKYGEDLEFNIRLAENGLHLRFDPRVVVWHRRTQTLSNGLKHLLNASIEQAPLFASWRVFAYSRYESLIASFYLSFVLIPLLLAVFWISPIYSILFTLVLLFTYTVFTVLRTKTYKIKVICYMPLLITLTTMTRVLGFCIGITKHILNCWFLNS